MTDQEAIEYALGKFSFSDLGDDILHIQGEEKGVSGDHWVSCTFTFKEGKLVDMELLA